MLGLGLDLALRPGSSGLGVESPGFGLGLEGPGLGLEGPGLVNITVGSTSEKKYLPVAIDKYKSKGHL